MKKMLFVAVFAAMLLTAGFSYAQSIGDVLANKALVTTIENKLKLSAEQKPKFEAAFSKFTAKIASIKTQAKAKAESAEAVNSKIDTEAKNLNTELKGVLNPDQYKQYSQWLEEQAKAGESASAIKKAGNDVKEAEKAVEGLFQKKK